MEHNKWRKEPTLFGVKEAKRSLLQELCQMPMPDLRHCKHTVSIQADPIVGPKKALRLSKRPNESRTLQLRGLRCYPLRVAFLRISGLFESLDCPSDWFVGVAEEEAMPKN